MHLTFIFIMPTKSTLIVPLTCTMHRNDEREIIQKLSLNPVSIKNNAKMYCVLFLCNQKLNSLFEELTLDTVMLILKSMTLITIILLAIINNSLVILSVIIFRKLRHVNNYFLVSLAFADLSVAIFAMTFNATVEITGESISGLDGEIYLEALSPLLIQISGMSVI